MVRSQNRAIRTWNVPEPIAAETGKRRGCRRGAPAATSRARARQLVEATADFQMSKDRDVQALRAAFLAAHGEAKSVGYKGGSVLVMLDKHDALTTSRMLIESAH